MIQWKSDGMTEVISGTVDVPPFDEIVALLEDLHATATPRYSAEVLQWYYGDRSQPLVMGCGDIWEHA